MKINELHEKLVCEGCNESNFAVLARKTDAFCLNKKNGKWTIFYSERGCDSEPIFTSTSEEEACEFFFNHMINQEHWHIVGFFKNESDAIQLEKKLTSMGLKPVRNDIPAYKTSNDPRYRIFVVGKEIFKARKNLGNFHIIYD